MNVGQLEARYRGQTGDTRAPYFCSRETFLGRLNEAQIEAARRAHLLVDSTSELTRVSVSARDPVVVLDPRIIKVRRVCLQSSGWPLRRASARDLDAEVPGWEAVAPGNPTHFVPDWQTGVLRLYRAPSVRCFLSLTVIREPEHELVNLSDIPEIPERYHPALLEWVKYRTYSDQDADTLDPKAAEKALLAFTVEFGASTGAINEHWSAEQDFDNGEF